MKRLNISIIIGCLYFACVWISPAFAQVSVTQPAADLRVAACEELATNAYGDPWDMSNSADINNFTNTDIGNISSTTFSGGVFSFVTNAANSGFFYLFSPEIAGAYRVGGRWGQDLSFDTNRFRSFSMRMFTNMWDSGGIKLIWNRGRGYVADRSVTSFIPTKPGWHVYRVDLINDVSISAAESSNQNPWSSGSVTGFALMPQQQALASVAIDYVRIEDPTTCGMGSISYDAQTLGNDNLFSLYLDDNSDPLDGFHSRLVQAADAAGAGMVNFDSLGLPPGSYNIVGLVSSDFATIVNNNPWDMNNSDDISLSVGVTGESYSGGAYSAVTSDPGPAIYLRLPSTGIDASKFRFLSFKLTRSAADQFQVFWSGGGGLVVNPAVHDSDDDDVFEIDLGSIGSWTGTISQLILRPTNLSGVNFSLDFVSLRSAGYVTSLPDTAALAGAGNLTVAPSKVLVNSPPLITILRPDQRGGEAIRPWNMVSGDFPLLLNLRSDTDAQLPSEPYTAYLPDVRYVAGQRGDFFKGTNELGSDDPNNFSSFPNFSNTPLVFDASQYRNLCAKLMIDRDFDLCLGSVLRVLWADSNSNSFTSDDLVAIYDRWSGSRWYEYCVDMGTIRHEDDVQIGWNGNITTFRVDPHEFSRDTCGANGQPTGNPTSTTYYFDWIKLRKDNTADTGKYLLVYSLSDPDDESTISFYYQTEPNASGGQLIVSGLEEGDGTYEWDTSGLADGTYYLYAVATDGINSSARLAKGRIVVSNTGKSPGAAPILSLQSPLDGQNVCNDLQVKGFALEPERFEDVSALEVLVDGSFIGRIIPSQYSLNAKAQYPNLDSSNSGFNSVFDVSALSAGTHTVEVKAISRTTQLTNSGEYQFTKGAVNCPEIIMDPEPSGIPESAGNVGSPETVKPRISKATLSKKGLLQVTVSNATDSLTQCTLYLKAGISKNQLSNIKAVVPSADEINFSVSGIKINKSKLPSFFMSVSKDGCSNGFARAESGAKKITAKTLGKIGSAKALLKKLKRIRIQS